MYIVASIFYWIFCFQKKQFQDDGKYVAIQGIKHHEKSNFVSMCRLQGRLFPAREMCLSYQIQLGSMPTPLKTQQSYLKFKNNTMPAYFMAIEFPKYDFIFKTYKILKKNFFHLVTSIQV